VAQKAKIEESGAMNGLLPKWLLKIAAMSCCYAASVPLFEWCFNSKLSFAYLLNEYWISLVYTVFIASVLSVGTPLVWQKSCRSPVVLRWLARGSFVFFGTGIACLLAGLIPWAVFRETYGYWQSFFESFRMALILSTIAVAFIASYETQKGRLRVSEMQLKTKELERERALKLATEARLSSLESRIHPHFLFNTINSVSSLIPEDPQRAERVPVHLPRQGRHQAGPLRGRWRPARSGLRLLHLPDVQQGVFTPSLPGWRDLVFHSRHVA